MAGRHRVVSGRLLHFRQICAAHTPSVTKKKRCISRFDVKYKSFYDLKQFWCKTPRCIDATALHWWAKSYNDATVPMHASTVKNKQPSKIYSVVSTFEGNKIIFSAEHFNQANATFARLVMLLHSNATMCNTTTNQQNEQKTYLEFISIELDCYCIPQQG